MYGPGVADLTNDEIDQLQRLEEGMWLTSTRSDRAWMERHLAPDFHEVGRSGRRWTRGEILAMPIGEIESTMPLPEFSVRQVGEEVALVTYRSVVAGSSSFRSSIWSRSPGGWQLEFHQGTPDNTSTT